MKAIQYTAFGNSSVIALAETDKPSIGDDEILIRAAAVTVNPADIKFRSGAMQQRMPVDLPFIPGLDVAGTVEETGKNVSRINVGDRVFGGKFGGTYSEYVTLKEESAAVIPQNVSMVEAASLVVALLTAHTFLSRTGRSGAASGSSLMVLREEQGS